MNWPGRLLLTVALFGAGCSAIDMPLSLPDGKTLVDCNLRGSAQPEGIQRPHLVEQGKSVRGLLVGSGGYACVEATVTAEGRVAEARILATDNRSFANAFVRSLDDYVFKPALKDGVPVSARVVIPGVWSAGHWSFDWYLPDPPDISWTVKTLPSSP